MFLASEYNKDFLATLREHKRTNNTSDIIPKEGIEAATGEGYGSGISLEGSDASKGSGRGSELSTTLFKKWNGTISSKRGDMIETKKCIYYDSDLVQKIKKNRISSYLDSSKTLATEWMKCEEIQKVTNINAQSAISLHRIRQHCENLFW